MIFQTAAEKLGVPWPGFVNLSPQKLYSLTTRWAGRTKQDIQITDAINNNLYWPNRLAHQTISAARVPGARVGWNGLTEVYGNSEWPGAFAASAFTMGTYIFYAPQYAPAAPKWLRSHEYIHVLQFESFGPGLLDYLRYSELEGYGGGPGNPYEAIAYLWQGWTWAYGATSYSRYWRPAP